jgi:putative glutamine amidotransferase
VNSLHGQAVNRLADTLRVEAVSCDGVIEAFSARDRRGYCLGVQWHPEWLAADSAVSMNLLHDFGAACHSYRDRRLRRAT